jgi:hypothetical protein
VNVVGSINASGWVAVPGGYPVELKGGDAIEAVIPKGYETITASVRCDSGVTGTVKLAIFEMPEATAPTAQSGTISKSVNTATVTGSGTSFTSSMIGKDLLTASGRQLRVVSVESSTSLTVAARTDPDGSTIPASDAISAESFSLVTPGSAYATDPGGAEVDSTRASITSVSSTLTLDLPSSSTDEQQPYLMRLRVINALSSQTDTAVRDGVSAIGTRMPGSVFVDSIKVT